MITIHRANAAHDFRLFIAQGFAVRTGWWFHRQKAHHLQQVILDDIANHPHLFIELAPPVHPELLGHRNLHVFDVLAVPRRLQERVRKPKVQQILHCLFAQIMIDAKDLRLVKTYQQRRVERLGGGEVTPERFLQHYARVVRTRRFAQPLNHGRKQ